MISRHTLAVLLMASLLFSGCTTLEKTAFAPDSKKKIKTIAVIGVSEPDNYVLDPGQVTGGSALYAFGALGGLILGGIEASRTENATKEFTASVRGTQPGLAQHWNESLITLLQSKGYQVTQLPPLPKKDGKNEVDCSSTVGKFDAVLLSTLAMTGYVVESMVEPRVVASVRLLSNDCVETNFSDGYIYSAKSLGKLTHIIRDAELSFPSREALLADPQKARRAMRTGLTEIAKTVSSEF